MRFSWSNLVLTHSDYSNLVSIKTFNKGISTSIATRKYFFHVIYHRKKGSLVEVQTEVL